MDTAGIRRVLVIKLRHIGDVLLTTPTLKALKTAMPEVGITALVRRGMEEMLTLNPNVEEVIGIEKGKGLMAELRLIRRLRAKRFDLAINMTEGDRGAILALLSGARHRIGIDPQGRGFLGKRLVFDQLVKTVYDGRHRALLDMDVLRPLGISPEKAEVELFTSEEDDEYIDGLLGSMGIGREEPLAVVHPTSRWLFKCWRDEAVAEVIDYLEGRGTRVVLTSAPDREELEKVRAILSLSRSKPVDLSGRLTLKRLASLFKRSVLFFGVDTAPMHMAAAVRTPVVALFGPSDSKTWGPLTDRRRIIEKSGEFACLPCQKAGCDDTRKSRCLDAITVAEAVGAIESLIGAEALKAGK